ncbi:hypothetical protein AB0J40_18970 [Amycolatopsis sp. NPDC049691]|uniref:hypothetical protein n=1 Tax=Amycolatopsis sp. NPDC049691 TaxID=3155155 RepID=UPI0034390113
MVRPPRAEPDLRAPADTGGELGRTVVGEGAHLFAGEFARARAADHEQGVRGDRVPRVIAKAAVEDPREVRTIEEGNSCGGEVDGAAGRESTVDLSR